MLAVFNARFTMVKHYPVTIYRSKFTPKNGLENRRACGLAHARARHVSVADRGSGIFQAAFKHIFQAAFKQLSKQLSDGFPNSVV
jgi:hypothetical protein